MTLQTAAAKRSLPMAWMHPLGYSLQSERTINRVCNQVHNIALLISRTHHSEGANRR